MSIVCGIKGNKQLSNKRSPEPETKLLFLQIDNIVRHKKRVIISVFLQSIADKTV